MASVLTSAYKIHAKLVTRHQTRFYHLKTKMVLEKIILAPNVYSYNKRITKLETLIHSWTILEL
jgi:hypothetical protein